MGCTLSTLRDDLAQTHTDPLLLVPQAVNSRTNLAIWYAAPALAIPKGRPSSYIAQQFLLLLKPWLNCKTLTTILPPIHPYAFDA